MTGLRWLATIRGRIAVTIAIAVLGSTVAATYLAYQLEHRTTRDRFVYAAEDSTFADAQQAASLARAQPTDAKAAAAVSRFLQPRNLDGYAILIRGSTAASVCASSLCPEYPPPSALVSMAGQDFSTDSWVADGRVLLVTQPIKQTSRAPLTLIEYFDYGDVQKQLARLRNDLLRVVGVGVVVAVLLGLVVSAGITRPIRRTARAAQRLGTGDLDTRIPVRGSGQLAALAINFNTMARRLSDTLTDLRLSQSLQQRFVADVSHELRTPLAAMVAAGEGLDSADPAIRARAAALVREQTRRMATMVDDLLEMSRFDAGQTTLDVEPVDLAELARDVVRTVAPAADVRVTAFGDVVVDVDARRIHTILRNLVVNAVQHGEPPVDVVVDARSDPVVVTVADDGPGVPADIVDSVFDRFVRADTARTSTAEHADGGTSTGLGLAIAVENAHLHGATVQIAPSGRTAFSLHLPRATIKKSEPTRRV